MSETVVFNTKEIEKSAESVSAARFANHFNTLAQSELAKAQAASQIQDRLLSEQHVIKANKGSFNQARHDANTKEASVYGAERTTRGNRAWGASVLRDNITVMFGIEGPQSLESKQVNPEAVEKLGLILASNASRERQANNGEHTLESRGFDQAGVVLGEFMDQGGMANFEQLEASAAQELQQVTAARTSPN